MLRDIYCISENETRYDDNKLEVVSELEDLLQQIDVLLFTKKGDILNMPNFGIDLERYLFSTNYNESVIENDIRNQIDSFIYSPNFNIDISVKFQTWEQNVAMIVDIVIKDQMGNSESIKYLI